MATTLLRSLLRLIVLAWALACGLPQAASAAVLELDAGQVLIDAWPALRMLPDASHQLTLDQVRQRQREFAPPAGPSGNFGVRHEAMWLHLPLRRSGDAVSWVLDIDYAPLNRVDAYLLSEGRLVQQVVLGNAQPFDLRPMLSRTHAFELKPGPGVQHELYLRVQTQSSMLVPITLQRADRFHARDAGLQLLHGVMLGIALGLLVYSLANWASLREPLFLQYALLLTGMALFYLSYSGVGQQHLWHDQSGMLEKIAPQGVLLALAAGSLFIGTALQMNDGRHARLWLGLRLVSMASLVSLAASLAGLVGYRTTQALATGLGLVPLLLAVPVAFVKARRGERVAKYMLLGWSAYLCGIVCAAGLLRGLLPANFWTQHLLQFASIAEMVAWVRVLGLRIEDLRRGAERAELERSTLLSLAHTDALTGLPNRRGLNELLARALAQARADSALAVFMIDLDGFKLVNDRLGHDAGDELLVQVARRLQHNLRGSDVVARLGGDEFVIVAAGLPAAEGDAQRIGAKLLDAFGQPFEVAGQRCSVGLTMGFALAPHDGHVAGDLLKRADAAMYAGKQAGRHCLRRGAASPGLVSA